LNFQVAVAAEEVVDAAEEVAEVDSVAAEVVVAVAPVVVDAVELVEDVAVNQVVSKVEKPLLLSHIVMKACSLREERKML
jgi:hypothetical protein